MSINLKELLKLPLFKNATLYTDNSTIDKNVNWVYLGDTFPHIEDIKPWVEPGNLLILIGHFIHIGNYTLDDVIHLASEMAFAGIVVYESEYIKHIPKKTIDNCNTKNMPLISISWEIPYTDLNKEILTCISASSLHEKSHEDMLYNIIFNNDTNYKNLQSRFIQEDFPFDSDNVILVINFNYSFIDIKMNTYNEYEISSLKTYCKNIVRQLFDNLQVKYMSLSRTDNIITIISKTDCIKIEEKEFEPKLNQLLNIKYPNLCATIGIGSAYRNMEDYKKSYKEAGYVIKAKKKGLVKETTVQYKDLNFYRLLFEINNVEVLKKLYPLYLSNIIEYDKSTYGTLMETLHCYLKSNKSINKAATELFVHKNTISYRIDKIKELTHLSLEEDQINFILMSEIAICRFINS